MIVPEFWSEARLQTRLEGGRRTVTVRRFGWSDTSQDEADAHAAARAQEATDRILAGETTLRRREPKRAYNGAEGVPIREEIVARHGPTIITRNGYGALCLNTPDVFFADIDIEPTSFGLLGCVLTLIGVVAGLVVGALRESALLMLVLPVAATAIGTLIARLLTLAYDLATGGADARARRRIDAFVDAHPDWHLRLYRTPAGLRLLALHRRFDPTDAEVAEAFEALGVDPIYARMCRHQRCFRARVSPKPWRIGIDQPLRPRRAVWPVPADQLPLRQEWIHDYNQAAAPYAACRFLETLGRSTQTDPAALAVQTLHDSLAHATTDEIRPLA